MIRTPNVRAWRMRSVLLLCVALLAAVGAAFAWIGIRAFLAKGELEALVPIAREVQAAASDRDLDRLDGLAGDLALHASNAAALTGDPLWGVASAMPAFGADFAAVHTVSKNLDAISTSGIQPLLDIVRQAQAGSDETGLDLSLVESASAPLADAAAAFAQADVELSGIRRGDLLPPLADGVASLTDAVSAASPVVTTIARAAEVLPRILGADRARTILITVQNPAEPRTGGGITGSFALLSAVEGRLAVVDQTDAGAFPTAASPVVPIPPSTVELYGDVVGRFAVNTSMTADFTLTGLLASAWWQQRTGTAPDAVVSVDPEVLAALLSVTGPVTLADGTQLDSGSLVQTLLVDAYFDLDRDEQTVLQQSVTTAVVTQLLAGRIDPLAWFEALRPAIDEGRVSLWSAHEDEQSLIGTGSLAGPAARHAAAGADAFAVYLNDRTGGKMGSFLESSIGVGAVECRPDGRQDVVVRVALWSTAPREAADFPWWVSGGGLEGIPPGDIGTSVTVAAPRGMLFGGVRQDGHLVPSTNVEDVGFPSSLAAVVVSPGAGTTLEFRFIAEEPGSRSPVALSPPLMNAPWADDEFVAQCAP